MKELDFIPDNYRNLVGTGKVSWQSPSNIALVKYWGKKEGQLPANPSISFTLDACRTTTTLSFERKEKVSEFDFEVYLEDQKKESFRPKILSFFQRIERYLPFLREYSFSIQTSNSFPHSSGIASSASGMSALALCLMSLEKQMNPAMTEEFFLKKASFLARLGSGSASRSIEGGLVTWGKHAGVPGSSDLFGVQYNMPVHELFQNYQDTILLIDENEKQVSSTLGHDLMKEHPFAQARFPQAHANIHQLQKIFERGDLRAFVEVVESEALTLHAMMMTSRPYFLLMKPGTLEVMNKIFAYRRETGLHLCFTLDAGANVHVLYPEKEKEASLGFIRSELVQFCQNGQYITDQVGPGAAQLA